MNILIVDDEPLAVQSLRLEAGKVFSADAHFDTAGTARQALQLARVKPVDIAFLDIEMPEMNGLELAQALKEIRGETNIVFVTAYTEYAMRAWQLHASDYLLKPASEQDIRTALANLRTPLFPPSSPGDQRLQVQCFGNFEVFFHGERVHFERSGARELFAYLVSRRGAGVSAGELCSILWEDDGNVTLKKNYVRTYFSSLRKTLRAYGLEQVVSHTRDAYAVDPNQLDCDYYRFLEMDPVAVNSYHSEFMSQYSWAEMMIYSLDRLAEK